VKFEYLGYLGTSDVEKILDHSHAMLFPTLEDEWGLVVNESLGRGCPVIGSIKSEAVNELIVNGKNGWSYDPTEDGQLWDALDQVIDKLSDVDDYLKMRSDCVSSVEVASPKNSALALSSACIDSK
jgi:glycosyltransferase involved in cell wall biosynthesis